MAKNNIPETMTVGALYDKYAERMALFASRSKACIELSGKYYSEHQDKVDKHIKAICHGEKPLQYILGLDTVQSRNAVLCLACILSSDEDDKPQLTEDLLSTYLKNTKKEKLPAINEKALEAVYSKIESTPDDDKSKQTIAYDAFTEHKLNPPSRAFFAVYAPRYKNFDSCSNDIYTNALLAMMLLGNINTTAKVRYMERYDYLYRNIVRPRFAAKSFGATWINDSNTMRRKTGIERDEENALQMPLIATLTASGVMNQQRMDKQVLSKEMLMHMAVAAYTAAGIDKVDAPLEKVWEAIDAENESAYDDETIQIAKEKVKIFRTALFNATYYTMLCEQTKKTVLEGLQDYFFNPQGTRLNNELKKCKRQMERDGELLKQQKESLKEYKVRADAAERAAEAQKFAKQQEAEGIEMVGKAEAEAIRQKGLAEAEAMKQKAEAYKQYNDAAVAEMLIKVLPDIAKSVAQPLSSIDKVSIIGGDASGVSGVSGNVPVLMAQTMQTVKEATGIDMGEIVRANSIQAKTDRNIHIDGVELDEPKSHITSERVEDGWMFHEKDPITGEDKTSFRPDFTDEEKAIMDAHAKAAEKHATTNKTNPYKKKTGPNK